MSAVGGGELAIARLHANGSQILPFQLTGRHLGVKRSQHSPTIGLRNENKWIAGRVSYGWAVRHSLILVLHDHRPRSDHGQVPDPIDLTELLAEFNDVQLARLDSPPGLVPASEKQPVLELEAEGPVVGRESPESVLRDRRTRQSD